MPYWNAHVATMPSRNGMIASHTTSVTRDDPGGSKSASTSTSCLAMP